MEKLKWVKYKEWYGYSYKLFLPGTDYVIGKIMTRGKKEYDIALPNIHNDSPQSSLDNAKSEVIKRLKDISKDLQNLLK